MLHTSPLDSGYLVASFLVRAGFSSVSERTCTASPTAEERLKLFGNMHGFHYEIGTPSEEAQALFDQVGRLKIYILDASSFQCRFEDLPIMPYPVMYWTSPGCRDCC